MTNTVHALITGTSSGIGLATALQLLGKGYRVTGIARSTDNGLMSHNNYSHVTLDISELACVESCFSKLLKTNSFDCFIHAAGSGQFGSIEQFSVNQIDAAIRTNLTSALVMSRQLLPYLRKRESARMIFIGSESSLIAGRKGALYSAAKFGLRGLCQALREDCARDGINVSLINPGMVRSPFFDELSFRPAANAENAIAVDDVALLVWQILQSSGHINFDEVNVSPRIKSIDFAHPKSTTE